MTPPVIPFLVRAAREFRRGGYAFTGFHWPVLAAQLAHRLPGPAFGQLFESGAVCHGPASVVPTSTTDYPALAAATGYCGSTADALFALARRCDRVVLDAANVDVRGRVNATAIGPYERPRVRLAGGGGAADAAAAAAELVLLHGGADPRRVCARVEHVTAAPAAGCAAVTLHTRWGVVRLGRRPALLEIAEDAGEEFRTHLAGLEVDVRGARAVAPPSGQEWHAARGVLVEAAGRGYRAAAGALAEDGVRPAAGPPDGGEGDGDG